MTNVALLHWPREQHRLADLRAVGLPRLVLVDNDQEPPTPTADPYEDWVRLPANAVDIDARMTTLRLRASAGGGEVPSIDDDGVVRFGSRSQPMPPVEARLVASLIDRFGAVVARERLMRAGWPSADPGRNALDVHVLRLRRRLAPLGLSLKTVRSRGYLLSASDSVQQPVF